MEAAYSSDTPFAYVGIGSLLSTPLMVPPNQRAYSWKAEQINDLLNDFEDALAGLGSKARRDGHTLILHSTEPSSGGAELAPIDLPSSWTLIVEPPIVFRYDGICTGGMVRVRFPAGEKSYRLQAPLCRPEAM